MGFGQAGLKIKAFVQQKAIRWVTTRCQSAKLIGFCTPNLRDLGITITEIAMLDEFDEGTVILPIADGYCTIPANQYFVIGSADYHNSFVNQVNLQMKTTLSANICSNY